MKNSAQRILVLLLVYSVIHSVCFGNSISKKNLTFKPSKSGGWSLRKDFLNYLIEFFPADVFVESGTSYGNTVKAAKEVFAHVHSIELEENFYAKARQNFASDSQVHIYFGDSADVLPTILPKLVGNKIMFWLDGHYSGGTTAQGQTNSPVMKELEAIKRSGINNATIMIDDMCCFHPDMDIIADVACGYPSVDELRVAVLAINPAYEIIMYGDIMIAYINYDDISVSPLIQAMTTSRFFKSSSMSYVPLFKAEAQIAQQTKPEELEALWDMCTYHFGWHRTYPYLWYSLALFSADRYAEAYDNLKNVLDAGYDHWRIYWYLMQAGYRCNKDFESFVPELHKRSPDLTAAALFLKQN